MRARSRSVTSRDHGVVGHAGRRRGAAGARPDPALDAVEPAQAIRRLGRLAHARAARGTRPAWRGRPGARTRTRRSGRRSPRAAGRRACARRPGRRCVQTVRPSSHLARDDELGDPAEHALEARREIVALVRGLVQRRHVGDHAVDVDDAVLAQAVREDALPDPALDAVVAAQAVLELERVQQALVLVAEELLVARAVVRVNRGDPLRRRCRCRRDSSPSSDARRRQRDLRDEAVVRVRLAAVDVQAERVDDCVQSSLGSALCLDRALGMAPRRSYRQERPCTEALLRAMRTHTSRPWNATAAARGRTRSSAAASGAARRVARRRSRPRAADARGALPASRAASASCPVSAATILGPERGREAVASRPAGARAAPADRRPGSGPDRAPRRSCAAGGGRRGRAAAGRRARAARARTASPGGVRVEQLALEVRRSAVGRAVRARRRACAPSSLDEVARRERGDVARLHLGRVALDERLRRQLAVVVVRARRERRRA